MSVYYYYYCHETFCCVLVHRRVVKCVSWNCCSGNMNAAQLLSHAQRSAPTSHSAAKLLKDEVDWLFFTYFSSKSSSCNKFIYRNCVFECTSLMCDVPLSVSILPVCWTHIRWISHRSPWGKPLVNNQLTASLFCSSTSISAICTCSVLKGVFCFIY